MRPIDADRFKESLMEMNNTGKDTFPIDVICDGIDEQPTVDSVVHCKDCYFSKVDDEREPKYKCLNICRDGCTQLVGSDDYCSYGFRKEEVENNT